MDHSRLRKSTLKAHTPFNFSQASLQDFADCARRYQLRYLTQLAWPAPQAAPIREHEQQMVRGDRFHRLAQQALNGVPLPRLDDTVSAAQDVDLNLWWQQFKRLLPELQNGQAYVEHTLSMPFGSHRLAAKYDLIQVIPETGNAVIWDWKTSPKRTARSMLQNRLQSLVYPYLLLKAGADLHAGSAWEPAQVRMMYWFPADPTRPEKFQIDEAWVKQTEKRLQRLVEDIGLRAEYDFEKTPDEKACRFCVYRSFCERGEIGAMNEEDQDIEFLDLETPFEQVAEISY